MSASSPSRVSPDSPASGCGREHLHKHYSVGVARLVASGPELAISYAVVTKPSPRERPAASKYGAAVARCAATCTRRYAPTPARRTWRTRKARHRGACALKGRAAYATDSREAFAADAAWPDSEATIARTPTACPACNRGHDQAEEIPRLGSYGNTTMCGRAGLAESSSSRTGYASRQKP